MLDGMTKNPNKLSLASKVKSLLDGLGFSYFIYAGTGKEFFTTEETYFNYLFFGARLFKVIDNKYINSYI